MTLDLYPARKDFEGGRFAYVMPLTYGRARIMLARADDEMSAEDLW